MSEAEMKIRDNYPDGKMFWFNDFYNDGENIFFSVGNFNGLYMYSLKDNRLLRLGRFKDEGLLGKQLYGDVYRFQNQLIFIPLSAFSIGIFNLENESFESVVLPVPKTEGGIESKFLNSVLYKDSIFAFPGYATYIIEYNINTKKITIHDDWYEEYINRWEKQSSLLFHFDMAQISDMVYIPSAQYNGWFQYCLSDNSYAFIEIKNISERINTLAYDGRYFWCSTNCSLAILDLNGDIVDLIGIDNVYGVQGNFYHSAYDKGNLWLFSSQSSKALRISCNRYKEEFEIIQYCAKEKSYTSYEYHSIDFLKRKNEEYFFLCRGNRTLYKIDDENIEKYLEAIEDTTEYSGKNVSDIEIYIEEMLYQQKADKYLHRSVFENAVPFEKGNDSHAEDIGTRIYRETL